LGSGIKKRIFFNIYVEVSNEIAIGNLKGYPLPPVRKRGMCKIIAL